jgi:hypothetical protein
MESLRTGKNLSEFSKVIDDYAKNAKAPIVKFIMKYETMIDGTEFHDIDRDLMMAEKKEILIERAEYVEQRFLNGKEKVTTDNYERSQKMVEAIKEHPVTGNLIMTDGHAELSFFSHVTVEVDGVEVKVKVRVRPDDLIEFPDEVWINDWKTIGDVATISNIKNACWRWRYDIQAAMYYDVVSQFTLKPVFFRLIFAESNDPAKEKVRVVQLSEQDLEAGWHDYRKALENKARWMLDNNVWKGFPIPEDGIDTIAMRKPQYQD